MRAFLRREILRIPLMRAIRLEDGRIAAMAIRATDNNRRIAVHRRRIGHRMTAFAAIAFLRGFRPVLTCRRRRIIGIINFLRLLPTGGEDRMYAKHTNPKPNQQGQKQPICLSQQGHDQYANVRFARIV